MDVATAAPTHHSNNNNTTKCSQQDYDGDNTNGSTKEFGQEIDDLELMGSFNDDEDGEDENNFNPEDFVSEDEEEFSSKSEEEEDFDSEEELSLAGGELFLEVATKFRQFLDLKVSEAEFFYDQGTLKSALHVDASIQTDPVRLREHLNVETQTEEEEGLNSYSPSFPISTPGEGGPVQIARREIRELRDAREPLNTRRKEVQEKIKRKKKITSSNKVFCSEEEKELFELEETLEAIDFSIEVKNEVITSSSSNHAPCPPGALTPLAPLLQRGQLQRLLFSLFTKVVELRVSSRGLEREREWLEDDRDRLNRRIRTDKMAVREKELEQEQRILHLLNLKGAPTNHALHSHILRTEEDLRRTKRKVLDYQRSLTELLVRHGYLLNGADYDVKQVVRMLGLDEAGVGNGGHRDRDRGHASNPRPKRRQIGDRRNAEILTEAGPQLQQIAHNSSNSSRAANHHRDRDVYTYRHGHGQGQGQGYDRDRDRRHAHGHTHERKHEEIPQQQQGTEVKRVKNKIIIQPPI